MINRRHDDPYGTTDPLEAMRSLEPLDGDTDEFARLNDCDDCGGAGLGCCVNADIPMPGTER